MLNPRTGDPRRRVVLPVAATLAGAFATVVGGAPVVGVVLPAPLRLIVLRSDHPMALPLRAALRSAGRFMVKNPTTMLSMARHALGMRIAVPLDALRWFIANTPPSKKAPQDITITPRPPAIGISATIDLGLTPGNPQRGQESWVGKHSYRSSSDLAP